MNRFKRFLFLTVAAAVAAMSASSIELPIKKVKGKEYFYYKVKKGETIYGLSKRLGLTREEIVQNNPSASDGLKKNMMLFFPVEEYASRMTSENVVQELADTATNETSTDTLATVEKKNATIALMLPFGLDNTDKPANRVALDFYKGFLIAADSIASRPGDKIDIHAFDTRNDIARIRMLFETEPSLSTASIIVGPEDGPALDVIAELAAENGTYVFNVLNFRDTAYVHNPYILQANIPQREMYQTAVRGLRAHFEGYTPVILRSTVNPNDKEAFVNVLAESYRADGIEPVIIEYQGNLLSADMEPLAANPAARYMIIPSGGSLQEFNKVAYVLRAFRDRMIASASGNGVVSPDRNVAIVGYPDWTAFRGEALDLLHKLEATVYSRFFDNFLGFEAKNIASEFRRWFGSSPVESLPCYGILGFDTGSYLIRNLRVNGGMFSPLAPASFSGIQSTFEFGRESQDTGYANKALYLIHYQPSGRVSAQVI